MQWEQGALNGAPYKLVNVAQFHVGETVMKVQKTALMPGGHEVLLYATVLGGIGALLPFTSRWIKRQLDERRLAAQVSFAGAVGHLTLDCDPDGRVRTIVGPRWGDPDGQGHRYVAFGGVVEAERSFDGYTIPSQLRLGWHYGGPRFVDEGEFFRVTVDAAAFR